MGGRMGFECRAGECGMCVVRMRTGEYGHSLESCTCVGLGLGSWGRAREKPYD